MLSFLLATAFSVACETPKKESFTFTTAKLTFSYITSFHIKTTTSATTDPTLVNHHQCHQRCRDSSLENLLLRFFSRFQYHRQTFIISYYLLSNYLIAGSHFIYSFCLATRLPPYQIHIHTKYSLVALVYDENHTHGERSSAVIKAMADFLIFFAERTMTLLLMAVQMMMVMGIMMVNVQH